MGSNQFRQCPAIEQIATHAEINDRANDEWLFDLSSGDIRIACGNVLCEFKRTLGIGFPKIDALAEPIIVIFALFELNITRENLPSVVFVAAMKPEYKARESTVKVPHLWKSAARFLRKFTRRSHNTCLS